MQYNKKCKTNKNNLPCLAFTAVCVHLDGLNAEHTFRVWVTILDHTSLHFTSLILFIVSLIEMCVSNMIHYHYFSLLYRGDFENPLTMLDILLSMHYDLTNLNFFCYIERIGY